MRSAGVYTPRRLSLANAQELCVECRACFHFSVRQCAVQRVRRCGPRWLWLYLMVVHFEIRYSNDPHLSITLYGVTRAMLKLRKNRTRTVMLTGKNKLKLATHPFFFRLVGSLAAGCLVASRLM